MAAYPLERKPMSIMLQLQLAQIWPLKYTKHPFWCLKTETGGKRALSSLFLDVSSCMIVLSVINGSAVCSQVCVW